MQTEDAGVLETLECEWEGARESLSLEGQRSRVAALQLTCGVGVNTQLALFTSRVRLGGGERERESGLAGKTGLWRGDGAKPAEVALTYAAAWNKASGDKTRFSGTALALAASLGLPGEHSLHLNLGHAQDQPSKLRSTTWGLAWEHAGIGALTPVAELFGDDRERPWWSLGLRWTAVNDKLFVDAAYGRQFASGQPTIWSLGFTWSF